MKFIFVTNRLIATVLFAFWASLCSIKAQPNSPSALINIKASSGDLSLSQATTPPRPADFRFNQSAYKPPSLQKTAHKKDFKIRTTNETGTNFKSAKYQVPAGMGTGSSRLKSEASKLQNAYRRQDLQLGKIERDVELLSTGGPITRLHQEKDRYTVKPGDTLFSIAARYGTSVGEVRALNHLKTDRVSIGTVLHLPEFKGFKTPNMTSSDKINVVTEHGHFDSMSRTYASSDEFIVQANSETVDSQQKSKAHHQPSEALKNTYLSKTHTVRKGETLSQIAIIHRVSLQSIMEANLIKNANKITLGQRLAIPGKIIAKTIPTELIGPLRKQSLELAEAVQPSTVAPTILAHHKHGSQDNSSAPTSHASHTSSETMRGVVAYRMQRGDSLESVASLFSTTVENIRALNKHLPVGNPREGSEIYVPTVGAISLN